MASKLAKHSIPYVLKDNTISRTIACEDRTYKGFNFFDEDDPLFPNSVLAEGVLDRLINKAHHVILTGKSYRPHLRPDRRGEVVKEVTIM